MKHKAMDVSSAGAGPRVSVLANILNTEVYSIKPYRKNYRLETDQGMWIAKHVDYEKRVQWWMKIDKILRQRGFRSMPTPMTDGRWLLTPFISGKMSSYSNVNHIVVIMRELGRFHSLGCKMDVPPFSSKPFLLYKRIYYRLSQFYRLLKRSVTMEGELGELIRVYGRLFYLDGLKAWRNIISFPIRERSKSAHQSGNIAHRDLASHNWIIDNAEQPWLIDFETAEYDCQLGDVWQIVVRILAENQWETGWLPKALNAYREERELEVWEEKLLSLLLSFPNEFFREAIGLASNRKGYHLNHALPYLNRLAQMRPKWKEQIKIWREGGDLR